MRILILGGTSFIGPHVVRELAAAGHDLTLFHRGKTHRPLPASVKHIHGDFATFGDSIDQLRALQPEVVLDMVPFREEDGRRVHAFAGVARRSVVLSSCDVYRAFGRILQTEPGEPDPVPLTEESPLREKLSPTGERYNKTAVERVAVSCCELPCTILRLPATHGPHDYQHRLFSYLKRMADGRPAILIDEPLVGWRWARGYVQNVAHAIALAVTNDRATGRIYNVADLACYTEMEWVRKIAASFEYKGRILSAPTRILPKSLRAEGDFRQHVILDTTRLRSELGFTEIIPEEDALRQTIEWELANPPTKIPADDFDYVAEDAAIHQLI